MKKIYLILDSNSYVVDCVFDKKKNSVFYENVEDFVDIIDYKKLLGIDEYKIRYSEGTLINDGKNDKSEIMEAQIKSIVSLGEFRDDILQEIALQSFK